MYHNLMAALPEEHIRLTPLPNEKGHNAVWDFKRSPEGRFFLSVCCETDKPLSALLYEYCPKDGGLRLICDIEKEWITQPGQMPHSKIHTSIDFLPGGRLIMATHNTAPARGHRRWAFEQHYEHIWEGFPGSVVLTVDPDTDDVKALGVPVPRESIYGGLLGDDPRYYFFTGYMRGHFYRLDLETNEVRDYGKISEFASFRLIKDNRGRIYGGTYTGELRRYDPAEDAVRDLKVFFKAPDGSGNRRQLCHALKLQNGNLLFVSNLDADMIELNPDTLETVRHGYLHLRPKQPVKPSGPMAGVGGFEIDENGVLYYGLGTYHGVDLMRLVRWDAFRGGEPENLGIISPRGMQSAAICEMLFDRDGILHMVDVCGPYSPYVLAVDVKRLQPPGPGAPDAVFRPAEMTSPAFNSDGMYFSFIAAEKTSTVHLCRHMPWADSAVRHMGRGSDGRMYAVCGVGDVLLSGYGDALLKYGLRERRACLLDIKSASVRGRAFRAAITGGLALGDSSVVCGTLDGMLYRIAPGLDETFACGRRHSSGMLRGFIRAGENAVLGIYGGADDAGRVFSFASEKGFVDLGRPRVNKEDSGNMQYSTAEWASIHEISCIAYDPRHGRLYVASAERYGCVMGYETIRN